MQKHELQDIKIAPIKLIGVALGQLKYEIHGPVSAAELNGQYDTNFGIALLFNEETELQTQLTISFKHKVHPAALDLQIVLIGKFACDDSDELKKFACASAATLMPYARTYISTITGWGPMQSITMPLMQVVIPPTMVEEAFSRAGGKQPAKKK